jgi:very-short-patch-repair endonuclease
MPARAGGRGLGPFAAVAHQLRNKSAPFGPAGAFQQHTAAMAPNHTPDNFSLASPATVNAGPPGSGADNGSIVGGGGASEPLTGPAVARDLVVSRITALQKTLITTEQLVSCGLSDDAVAYRLKAGRFHVVFRGVYTVGSGVLPPLALELAALLACGERTLISHRSAAFVWGLQKVAPTEVEVSVVDRCCKSRKGLRVHRIKAIDERDLRRHEGLWISSPARAVLEVAADGSANEVVDLIDAGVAGRLLTPAALKAVLKRNPGRRGAARLAAVLGDDSARGIARSRAERAFRKLIRDAGLPAPLVNQPLGPYVPDFMWREQRLIVEIDSYGFHGGPGGFQTDHEKDLVYRDAGFDVLRPTRNHVVHEPARVLVRVVRALERARSQ